MRNPERIVAMMGSLLLSATAANGQLLSERPYQEAQRVSSKPIDNDATEMQSLDLGSVRVAGASWVRVHIGAYELGRESFITLTGLLDGQQQRFDARSLPEWSHWSAFFNGDEVEISLHVAAGQRGIYVEVDEVRASHPPNANLGWEPGGVASICNDFDDRSASGDPRVARVRTAGSINGFCTAWLVSNGAVLSAGHCNIAAGDIIEFNVPGSLANGTNVASSVNNQYPVNAASIQLENNGRGEDWVIFGVGANANTGLKAHVAQGFFYMTKLTPNAGTTIRVTGYGLDNQPGGAGGSLCLGGASQGASCTSNANCPGGQCVGNGCCDSDGDGTCEFNCNSTSQTQQSTTGPMDDLDGDIIEHDVDTTPANSGSPILWEGSVYAFGVHTQGGCDNFIEGYNNHGTHLHRGPLEAALQNFLGFNTVYVDWGDAGLPANGSVYEPLHTLSSAVSVVMDGGNIAMVAGSYPAGAGNRFVAGADGKAMTFLAPVGAAIIGD